MKKEKYTTVTTTISVPKYVGSYNLGFLKISFTYKPCWFHRFFMKILLGFKWVDD